MSKIIRKALEAITPDAGDARSATGRSTVRSRLSQSPNKPGADRELPVSVARQLAFGTDADRAQLRAMVAELPPQAQVNLQRSIAAATRDPQSPRNSISLTQEGQLLMDVIFSNGAPPKEVLDQIRTVADPAAGTDLNSIPVGDDSSPKGAPFRPKVAGKFKEPFEEPAFRSSEVLVENPDGTFRVDHKDVHLDRQTAAAIKNAEAGEMPGVVTDQAALAASRAPLENYTRLLIRTAEARSPHAGLTDGVVSDGGVPGSVFGPQGSGKKRVGKSIATVNPADHSALMQLARQRGIANPNQLDSPEEFARALVAGADQEGFNVTPITASDRARATDRISDLSDDPASIPDAVVGREMRNYEPGAVSATKMAERAVMQEQAIQTLARKADGVFGHLGWGDNHKAGGGSAGVAGPSTEGPSLTGTTQDPGQVPAISVNTMGEPHPMPPRKAIDTNPQPTTIDPELTPDDLAEEDSIKWNDLDNASPIGGEADSIVRANVTDKRRVTRGGGDQSYQDDSDFSGFNRENVTMTDSDVQTRMDTYERLKDTMPLDATRSSGIRQRLRSIIDGAADRPLTADESAEVAALQNQLRLTHRLDEMSGIRSFDADPDSGDIGDNPASLMTHKLDASSQELSTVPTQYWDEVSQRWTAEDPYGLNGNSSPGMGRGNSPPPPTDPPRLSAPEADPVPPKQTPDPAAPKKSLLSRIGRGALLTGGAIGGGVLGYGMIRHAGKPDSPDWANDGNDQMTPEQMGFLPNAGSMYGGEIRPILTSSADRIRAAQESINRMRLNANTQIPSNWTK